jgi:hypothetical protein
MDGLGDFLGSLFEGVSEVAGEAAFAAAADGGYDSTMPGAGEGGRDVASETYERYLCGGPRDLNINDL